MTEGESDRGNSGDWKCSGSPIFVPDRGQMCPICEDEQCIGAEEVTQPEEVMQIKEGLPSGFSLYLKDIRDSLRKCKRMTQQCTCQADLSRTLSLRRAAVRANAVRAEPATRLSRSVPHSGDLSYTRKECARPTSQSVPNSGEFPTLVALNRVCEVLTEPDSQKKKSPTFSILRKLKNLTYMSTNGTRQEIDVGQASAGRDDESFEACGAKVLSVSQNLDREQKSRELNSNFPTSNAGTSLCVVPESDLDTTSGQLSLDLLSDLAVSESSISGILLDEDDNKSFQRASITETEMSSAVEDDSDSDSDSSSTVPRTSASSPGRDDWTSQSMGPSNRRGELDIYTLSGEKGGSQTDVEDTGSPSQSEAVQTSKSSYDTDDGSSESAMHQDLSIEDTTSAEEIKKKVDSRDIEFRVHERTEGESSICTANETIHATSICTAQKPSSESIHGPDPSGIFEGEETPDAGDITEQDHRGGGHTMQVATKVVVLLGKYGNRRGLRVAGLPPMPKGLHKRSQSLKNETNSLYNNISPEAATTAFQDEVAKMILEEGADGQELMDVEVFLDGYRQLKSPFYLEIMEEFFRAVCLDCFQITPMGAAALLPPAYAGRISSGISLRADCERAFTNKRGISW